MMQMYDILIISKRRSVNGEFAECCKYNHVNPRQTTCSFQENGAIASNVLDWLVKVGELNWYNKVVNRIDSVTAVM